MTPFLQTNDILALARKHLGKGEMESSARVCLSDATYLYDNGDLQAARLRALNSISYSVGMFHPDYIKAKKRVLALNRL
jgi:hypothetical protein